ncbi:hypothetical protein DH2020_021572 [Rehmannia glutinosa]|uniref:RNase H type-1 domain-containing protein n=1 Tax=Rehmannia glutinosa TaxID=99300 RepID=A0ABR0WAV3_REHGL
MDEGEPENVQPKNFPAIDVEVNSNQAVTLVNPKNLGSGGSKGAVTRRLLKTAINKGVTDLNVGSSNLNIYCEDREDEVGLGLGEERKRIRGSVNCEVQSTNEVVENEHKRETCVAAHIFNSKRFKFENRWLQCEDLKDVVENAWFMTGGRNIQDRLEYYAEKLVAWNRSQQANFRTDIKRYNDILSRLREKEGEEDVRRFEETRVPLNGMYCLACWREAGLATFVDGKAVAVESFIELVEVVINELDHWMAAKFCAIMSRWKKPDFPYMKCNVDAAISQQRKLRGIGMILRNDQGDFVVARTIYFPGIYAVREAEAIGVREALSWIHGLGIRQVVLETDAKYVVDSLITQETGISEYDSIIQECCGFLQSEPEVSVKFVRRNANMVAHELAKGSFSFDSPSVWNSQPLCIVDLLSLDALD